jgi:hypothetical protein
MNMEYGIIDPLIAEKKEKTREKIWSFDMVSVPTLNHKERLLIAINSNEGVQQEHLYLPSIPLYLG